MGPTGSDLRRTTWRVLFAFTKGTHTLHLIAALVCTIASALVDPTLAWILGLLFDAFTKYGSGRTREDDFSAEIYSCLMYFLGVGALSWAINGSFFAFWVAFGDRQGESARITTYLNLLNREIAWLEQQAGGATMLVSRIQSHFQSLANGTAQSMGFVLQSSISIVVALSMAFYFAWDLTLITLSMIPFAVMFITWLSSRMEHAVVAHEDAMDRAAMISCNAVNAIDMIKSIDAEQLEVQKYRDAVNRTGSFYLRYAYLNALRIGVTRLVTLGMFVQGFWYANHIISTGKRTPGQLLTAFWACLIATQAFEQIMPRIVVLDTGRIAASSLESISRTGSPGRAKPSGSKMRPRITGGRIEFEAVSFSYATCPQKRVLENITLVFPPGETTCVVGSSGSGKTTIASLLLCLYKPSHGTIKLDGELLQNLDPAWVRDNFAIVNQDPELFNDSLLTNVLIARGSGNVPAKDEVEECIEFSGLSETVRQLPKGVQTLLGQGGTNLSGGQRQRLAVSRARLRDAPMLILDEATSALDFKSRSMIMTRIREWRQAKSTIIITHDLSQIGETDYVYHLQDGRVAHDGYWGNINSQVSKHVTRSSLKETSQPRTTQLATIRRRSDNLLWRYEKDPQNLSEGLKETLYTRGVEQDRLFVKAKQDLISDRKPSNGQRRVSMVEIPDIRLSIIPGLIVPLSPLSPTSPSSARHALESPLTAVQHPESAYDEEQSEFAPLLEYKRNPISSGGKTADSIKLPQSTGKAFARDRTEIGPRTQKKPTLRGVLSTVWPSLTASGRFKLLVGALSALCHALATPIFAFAFARLLLAFELSLQDRSDYAAFWSFAILGVAFADSAAAFLMHYLLDSSGQEWADHTRIEAMRQMLSQPRAWFDSANHGLEALAGCFDQSADEMRNLIGRFAAFSFVAASMLLAAFTWSIVLCWKLALIGILPAPFLYLLSKAFENMSQILEAKSEEASAASARVFMESISKIKTVRVLGLEAMFLSRYQHATRKILRTGFKRAWICGLFIGAMDAAMVLTQAVIFWLGSYLVVSDGVAVTTVITVFSMLLFSISNAGIMISFIPQITAAQVAASKLLGIVRLPGNTSGGRYNRLRLPDLPGPIEFKNFNFMYPTRPHCKILDSLTLSIPLGASTGLVGASGSGKTTILASLLGIYYSNQECSVTADETIMLGGLALSQYHLPTFRSLIGYVPQSITLFPDTIANNILYALDPQSPLASQESLEEASRLAGFNVFVHSLPNGYNTRIGEGGLGLSMGQIQRIGIARALARRPRLLIMDEPTSNLDLEAAAHVQESIKSLVRQGTTVVLATHSMEMMRSLDRLVVIEAGRATESGPWTELIHCERSRLRHLLEVGDVES